MSTARSAAAPPAGRPSVARRVRGWLAEQALVAGIVVGVFVAWEAGVAAFRVPPFILPPPSQILRDLVGARALLLEHTWITVSEVVIGFLASVMIGVPLAIGIVYSRIFEKVAYTFIVPLQTIPKVALAPLVVLWFGYGLLPKVVVACLISFFPVVIASVVGFRAIEQEMLYLARSLDASEWQTFLKFRLPRALPNIFGGFKVGIGQAVVGAVVGEFIAAERGLGYLQIVSSSKLETSLLFGSVAVISLVGLGLFALLVVLERLAMPWYRPAEPERPGA
jgi:NitT/TauT family transport system permease protein